MPRPLGADRALDFRCHGFVIGAGAEHLEQVELAGREQAGAELAVGCQSHTIAVAAERLRYGRDHADGAASIEVAPTVSRCRAARCHLLEWEDLVDCRDDLVLRHDLSVDPVPTCVEGHELDEAHLDTVVASETCKVDDLVVVDTTLYDSVDLDRREAGLLRRVDAVEYSCQLVAPGHLEEPVGTQRVEADVDALESRVAQLLGEQPERRAIGREADVGRVPCVWRSRCCRNSKGRQLADENGEMGAHGGLATRESQSVDLETLDEDACQTLDLLERHHFATRQPDHALFWHAVGTAKVAAIGDRDAQVTNGASEGIDEIHGVRLPTRAARRLCHQVGCHRHQGQSRLHSPTMSQPTDGSLGPRRS